MADLATILKGISVARDVYQAGTSGKLSSILSTSPLEGDDKSTLPIADIRSEDHGSDVEELAVLEFVFGRPHQEPPELSPAIYAVIGAVLAVILSLPWTDALLSRLVKGKVLRLLVKALLFFVAFLILTAALHRILSSKVHANPRSIG